MKRTRLRINPPNEATIAVHRAIQSHGGIGDALLLSGGVDQSAPTELFSIRGDSEAVCSALSDEPGVRSVDLLSAEQKSTYVHVREAGDTRAIAEELTAETLVVTLPIRFRTEGGVDLTVLGSGADLQSAIDAVRSLADVTVLSVQDGWANDSSDALTDRQRTVLRAAIEAGYYDYPRTTNQADVADAVGVTDSTVAEHLRKAEAALVERALDGNPDPSIGW